MGGGGGFRVTWDVCQMGMYLNIYNSHDMIMIFSIFAIRGARALGPPPMYEPLTLVSLHIVTVSTDDHSLVNHLVWKNKKTQGMQTSVSCSHKSWSFSTHIHPWKSASYSFNRNVICCSSFPLWQSHTYLHDSYPFPDFRAKYA